MPHFKDMVKEENAKERQEERLDPTPHALRKQPVLASDAAKLPTGQRGTTPPNLWSPLTTEDTWSYVLALKVFSLQQSNRVQLDTPVRNPNGEHPKSSYGKVKLENFLQNAN